MIRLQEKTEKCLNSGSKHFILFCRDLHFLNSLIRGLKDPIQLKEELPSKIKIQEFVVIFTNNPEYLCFKHHVKQIKVFPLK